MRLLLIVASLLAGYWIAPAVFVTPAGAQSGELDKLENRLEQLTDAGDLKNAIPVAKHLLELIQGQFGPDSPRLEEPLAKLALSMLQSGQDQAAESVLRRLLALREKLHDPDDLGILETVNMLAIVSARGGKLSDAELFFKRTLSIAEKKNEPTVIDAALYNLLLLYAKASRFEEAATAGDRDLALRDSLFGPNDTKTAEVAGMLATVNANRARTQIAEDLYKRSIKIQEAANEPDLHDLIETLQNLAVLYYRDYRYTEAEEAYAAPCPTAKSWRALGARLGSRF